MPPYLLGLLYGLVFFLSLGPGFWALIQTSLSFGFRYAIFFAIGVVLCDALYAWAVIAGLSSIMDNLSVKFWLSFLGMIVLLLFGTYSILNKQNKVASSALQGNHNPFWFLFKGFALNIFNPFILVFWVTMFGLITSQHAYEKEELYLFFGGMLTLVISSDLIKALLANRLRYLMSPLRLRWMSKIMGIVLVVFGLRIGLYIWQNF